MSLRYKALFGLPERLYTRGAPMALESAQLLQDQLTGRRCARFVFQNIGPELPASVDITLRWLDERGEPLGEPFRESCEEAELPGKDRFLPAPMEAAGFAELALCFTLADGSHWQGAPESWQSLPTQESLEESLEPELMERFRLRFGQQCRFVPKKAQDLWLCSCGAVSRQAHCHRCGMTAVCPEDGLLQELREELRVCREEEERKNREEEHRRLETEKNSRTALRRDRRQILLGVAAAVAVAALGMTLLMPRTPVPPAPTEQTAVRQELPKLPDPKACYEAALAALEEGNYREAHRQFTLAGDYADAGAYLERFVVRELTSRSISIPGNGVDWVDLDGTGSFDYELEYTYDGQGRMIKKVCFQLIRNEQGEFVRSGEQEIGTWSYDEAGRLLESRGTTGENSWWDQYAYDDHGNRCLQETYVNGALTETITWKYVYDARDQLLWMEDSRSHRLDGGASEHITVLKYYDQKGRVTETFMEVTFTGNPGAEDEEMTRVWGRENCSYDEDGNLIYRREAGSGYYGGAVERVNEHYFTYDEAGRCLSQLTLVVEEESGKRISHSAQTWVYDEEGREISYTYNEDAEQASWDQQMARMTVYAADGQVLRCVTTVEYPGSPMRNNRETEEYRYDGEGRLLEERFIRQYENGREQQKNGFTRQKTYSYDELGRLVETGEKTFSAGEASDIAGTTVTEHLTYGADGLLDRKEAVTVYDDPEGIDYRREIVYNENGLVETESYGAGDSRTETEHTYIWFYDPEGIDP